jgi:hypothetical protein
MKSIIKQYYFFPFILFLILFVLKTFAIKSPNSRLQNILIVVIGALAGSIIVGTIYYFQDTKWGPAKRKKRLSKSPFKDLIDIGFERKDDFIVGKINDYTTIVMYTWESGKPGIKIDLLFNPRPSTDFLTARDIDQFEKRHKNVWKNPLYWTRNSIGQLFEYNFSPPSFKKIIVKAKEMSDILIKEGMRPISYEENEQVISELIKAMEGEKTNK